MKTVRFKSVPQNFKKEMLGIKSNTIRELEPMVKAKDIRAEILMEIVTDRHTMLMIEIENSETGETFTRAVKDVTLWAGWFIISW
jgi:hypothetical protein